MAISASEIVSVVPRILSGTGSDLVFNGMVFTKDERLPVNKPTSFSSAASVAEYFGDTSDEYEFASTYFGGYQNSQIKPSNLYFYRHCEAPVAAFVRGSPLKPSTALAALKLLTAGNLSISLTGVTYNVSVDLSESTSLSDAGERLQTALRALDEDSTNEELSNIAVSFDATQNAFTITNGKSGEEYSITCPTGTVADAMGFNSETATVSDGAAASTLTATLNTLTKSFQNFVTFTTIWEPDDDEALLLASWASSNASAGTQYLFVLWDSSKANLDATSTTVIAEKLKDENVGATAIVYPSYEQAAFVMGAAASIAWDNTNGTITFAFKKLDGMGADVENTDDAQALKAHKVNFVGNYGTRNDEFVWFYNGSLLGDWAWIDTYLNSIWLCNALQVQIMSGFESVRRVPYTERGYATIRAWCRDVLNRAVNNGVIEAGVNISETQKAALIEELGADYSDEIYTSGYYLQVLDATASTRQARTTPPCNLVYTYGGAVHSLSLPAIAVV